MLAKVLPSVLIMICSVLISIDLWLHIAQADTGLWLRITTNFLVIIGMVFTIRGRRKKKSKLREKSV